MSSSRLPGKVLADVAGQPMLARVCARVRRARRVDACVVATSDRSADDPVAELCRREQIPCFRGSELDVLDRVYHAAQAHQAAGNGGNFGMREVLDMLKRQPEITEAQGRFVTNEGYLRSLYDQAQPGPAPKRPLTQSEAWLRRSEKVIPGTAQTFSKGRNQY